MLESEALLRVLFADLGTLDQARTAIATIADEADDLLALADVIAGEYLSGVAPFQDQVHARALVFDFLVGFASHCAAWAARADSSVVQWSRAAPDERDAAALQLIRTRLAAARGSRNLGDPA
jgi:hypothetical protein